MPLSSLVQKIKNFSLTAELVNRCDRTDRLVLRGAGRSAKSLVTSAIAQNDNRPLLVVVPTLEEAGRWLSLLQVTGWKRSFLYPTSEGSPYETLDSNTEIVWGQLQVLSELISNKSDNIAVVTTERALQPHLPVPSYLKKKCIKLSKGEEITLEYLSNLLVELGYTRESTTEIEGTWSRRGDIVDIFPVSNELPVRLEFFGDELEKLKEFDPTSQRSLDSINSINLTPRGYSPLIAEELRKNLPDDISLFLDEESLNTLVDGGTPLGLRRLMGFVWRQPSSLLEYLPSNTCVVLDEKSQGIAHGRNWLQHVDEHHKDIARHAGIELENVDSIYPGSLHKSVEKCYLQAQNFWGFDLTELGDSGNSKNLFDLSSRNIQAYPNQFGRISSLIKDYQKEKYSVWILSAQPSRSVALLEEHDCIVRFVPNSADYNSITRLIEQNTPVALKSLGQLEVEGIELPAWKISLITDREIFGQNNFSSPTYVRRRRQASSKTINPNKMRPGDYVVHRNHGIGRFLKIEKIAISGKIRDYLVVQYLDGTLSVAADQLGSLGRYRSSNDGVPNINKLGGVSWNRIKEKTKRAVSKVAIDLIRLYSERSQLKGFPFPPDGPWQNELEDSFPYETTPDQQKAIIDVKRDMELNKPMDRLVCGDVGFGKTEVAIRAIFKAVTAGKQVAMLAPTTVLSQQHWRTINDRFAPYPIKVALLNRFRTTTERKTILEGLKSGAIDTVIGTHQLLSKKTIFNNLGFLVVDEEQRFGVNQKEKIKELRKDIDVLSLSATPIPRTLYMSLSGVREMSLITTPPPLRRPIKTHLSQYDDGTIRSAICQEIDRGGQIFYVLPRIEGINDVALKIQSMVPKIKIIIAHGQMGEGELENSMVAFNAGEGDLLLCTTIVESGLDIPRVNTIIIEESHKFGLSQLYQLRGRVGRSGIQAHAWLLYPNSTALSDTARQRLKAIQEFAQLGSGYQLAIRDMEIRGVGNLLGVEQSGQMESVGFDLYMEMLQECLSEIQGQSIPNVDDTQIDLTVTAFIPSDWIVNSEEKISAYRAATECKSHSELLDLAVTWTDRYGKLPLSVESLIQIMQLKMIAKKCGFSRIKQDKANVMMETPMEEAAFRLLRKGLPQHLQSRVVFKSTGGNVATVTCRGLGVLPIEKLIEQLMNWLNQMADQIPDSQGNINSELEKQESLRNAAVISL